MIEWYLTVINTCRTIEGQAHQALLLYKDSGKEGCSVVNRQLNDSSQSLLKHWKTQFPDEYLGDLARHIRFGKDYDYADIVNHDIPELRSRAEEKLAEFAKSQRGNTKHAANLESLLHPIILESSYQLFLDGHLRESVLNSITAIFDYIRQRTSSREDGDRLIGAVMSPNNAILKFSSLATESESNDQKGFMQILKGAYQGIRNPKAHSLTHDLNEHKAAQYLVFSSLLARRVEEAEVTSQNNSL